MKRQKVSTTRTSEDKHGNLVEEKLVYDAFVSYDAEIFLKTFYDSWFPDEKGQAQFKLTYATAKVIEIMESFTTYKDDYYAVKKNRLGRYCAIGDKMLFKATKYVEKAVLNALIEVETQKQFANAMYKSATSKTEQDYAMSYLLDKIKERETLDKCINESLTTQIIFKRKDRKELVKSFFENLNNPEQTSSGTKQGKNDDAQAIKIEYAKLN